MTRDYVLRPYNRGKDLRISYAQELNPQQLEAVTAPPGASLVYLASEDPERVSRETRSVIRGRGGQPGSWPTCRPAVRRSADSPRM